MYDLTPTPENEEGRRGSTASMDLGAEEESEDDVLKARRERLERAARLLDRARSGEVESGGKGGGENVIKMEDGWVIDWSSILFRSNLGGLWTL